MARSVVSGAGAAGETTAPPPTTTTERERTSLNSSHLWSFYSAFFFFNDTATTEIYPFSLHDALPICESVNGAQRSQRGWRGGRNSRPPSENDNERENQTLHRDNSDELELNRSVLQKDR